MDGLTSVVTITAAVCAILAAKERATDLSIPYICILVTMCLLALVLNIRNSSFGSYLGGGTSSSSSEASGSSEIDGRVRKINESLYELRKPLVPPSIQIVLFHGLQPGDYLDAHLRTWQSEDGSCIWPRTWLIDADAVPGAHVLSVSYNGGLANTSHGESDMYIITENILSDLLQKNIGQEDYCPVVLVGHSIGGLVIKHLCNRAHGTLQNKPSGETVKLEKLLNNIKGIFYYATPNHGTSIPKKWEKGLPRALLTYFRALSKDTERLNHEFHNLERVCNDWSLASLGENRATNTGPLNFFFRSVFVPEASARIGDFNIVNGADHFSICQPSDKLSRSFYKLRDFVSRIAKVAQDARKRADIRLQEEARALENFRPENLQYVPKSVIGLDIQVQAIKSKLDNVRSLGLVGMGGLGKTTLAKEVFNRLAPGFEFTCFIQNVKLIDGDDKKLKDTIEEEMHCRGKKVEKGTHQTEWKRKPLLLVLDDISGKRDGKVLSEIVDTTADESRIIFTTRNQRPLDYLGEVYRVDFLNDSSAKQLFLSCAFPNHECPPTKLEGLIRAITEKCEGLPLALEVLGKFLRTIETYEVWEQTLHAMGRAEDEGDIDERLWANLRLSYDGLEERMQQMFLDATTIFNDKYRTLHEAKAIWRVAYDTMTESILWQKLVDMSLVYDVKDNECIRVHEQLQSLGRKIARESINNGKLREWDGEEGSKLLQNTKELHKQEVFALRIGEDLSAGEDSAGAFTVIYYRGSYEDKEIHIANNALSSLTELRFLEVNVPVRFDGAEDCFQFQAKLVLLQCFVPEFSQVLFHPDLGADLVSLNVSWEKSCLPTYIGSFSKLRFLTLFSASHLERLPDEIGKLSQLEVLKLQSCSSLQTLPECFGSLSALNHLQFLGCKQLQTLPESFGNLSALSHLDFYRCDRLQTLPESFGNLSILNHLQFDRCRQLQSLPECFGSLRALHYLALNCERLQTLPKSFGSLSALNHLSFSSCRQLQTLPESFGSLSALNHLSFYSCRQLQTLPESFGSLSALNHLSFYSCRQLQTLPESFGSLSALNHLSLSDGHLQTLPESFGGLSALNHLELDHLQLQTLPESFGGLSALNRLEVTLCNQLQTLPETFGNLSALSRLRFCLCHQLQTLPESFGNLSALSHLEFDRCEQLQALPESIGSLSALTYLRFYDCEQLQMLPDSFGDLSSLNRFGFYHSRWQAVSES